MDLDIIEPSTTAVDYQGERLEIRPLTIGQLPKFVRIIRPLLDRFGALQAADDPIAQTDLVLSLVEEHIGPAIEAAALVTGKPVEWIEQGDTAEFLALVMRVVEVNRDFFAARLAPQLQALRSRNSTGAGPTPSNSSSATVTH